ncbi:MAG: signal peptidase II [Proteobacteria bacterium]|nr:signal peptidase II [Pseudomonadota bacterium]
MKIILKSIAIVLGVILLDQLAKGIILLLLTGGMPPWAAPAFELIPYPYLLARVTAFFNIVFTWNPGTSFSLFRNLGESAPLVIIVLSGVIIGAIGYYLFARSRPGMEKWGLALIVGGAMGNLIDRVRFGAVIDFLDFHVNNWHWPAFNVADMAITIGVGLLILNWILIQKESEVKKKIKK